MLSPEHLVDRNRSMISRAHVHVFFGNVFLLWPGEFLQLDLGSPCMLKLDNILGCSMGKRFSQ